MSLKNTIILGALLAFGFSVIGMERPEELESKAKVASTAQEWELLYVVSKNQTRYVEDLFDQNVNVNITDRSFRGPLEIAICNDSGFMVEQLVLNGAKIGKSDLRDAISNGRIEAAEALIRSGADVNSQPLYGYKGQKFESILMFAIRIHFHKKPIRDLISLLIEKGADINYIYDGKTAYDYAVKKMENDNDWDSEILELLKPKENTVECPICEQAPEESLITTECNHKFCKSCLNKWVAVNNNCPICRRDL